MLARSLKIALLLFALALVGVAGMAFLAGDRTSVPFIYDLSD